MMRRHTVRNTLLFFMSLLLCQSTVDPLWAYDDDVKEIPTCKSCSVTRKAKWAFGDMIYHLPPGGTWMVNFRFMRMDMNGLRDGTTNVPVGKVSPVGSIPYGYMMTPTEMTMVMYMLMVMYGVTERLTISAMGSNQYNQMDMLMNMGMGNVAQPPMRTDGLGDTAAPGSAGVAQGPCGGGTGKNGNDYSLGNVIKATGWLQRAFGPAASWLRLAYGDTGRIKGSDPEIDKKLDPVMCAPTTPAFPQATSLFARPACPPPAG